MKTPWDKENNKESETSIIRKGRPSPEILDEMFGLAFRPAQLTHEVTQYPDGSFYVEVTNFATEFTFHIKEYSQLWELNQIHDIVKKKGLRHVIVTIPNLIDAQADRRFKDNQPHGLKLVCEFLNSLECFHYKIFHPHNPEVVEALLDRVEIIDNAGFINSVLHRISEEWAMNVNPENLILMSSDAGGFKPLMKLCDKLNWVGETYSASKSRAYVEGKTKLTQLIDRQDFGGKDILIIDDLCSKGGTFKGLAKMLKERNCGKLYLAVSHMTVWDLGGDPVTDYFDVVFTTNSKQLGYRRTLMPSDRMIYPKNLVEIKLF